jgi:DNA polymerase elongation subunit (family B)
VLDFPTSGGTDKNLVRHASKVLKLSDQWVTYNGRRFDVPYIQTRMLRHHLGFLPTGTKHVDLYTDMARVRLNLARRSKDNVARWLGLSPDKPYDPEVWVDAARGKPSAVRKVVAHCRSDVELEKEIYLETRGLMDKHMRYYTDLEGCRICGARVKGEGRYITVHKDKHLKKIRVSCTECGAWDIRVVK